MSAPDTDIEKQEKRHKPSLVGMGAAVAFAGVLLAIFLMWTVDRGGVPKGADVQVDGRTGDLVPAETN